MNASPAYGAPPETPDRCHDPVVRTLLRQEWLRHRLGAISAMLFLVPTMALSAGVEDARPGVFFWLAFCMAWGIGLGIGRVEWQEGEEEFHLTLPATRAQRYWVQLAVGAAVLLAVYAIGAVTCFTDWFLPLWDSMELKPFEAEDLPPWVGTGPDFVALALALPVAAFVECFALSMGISRRGDAGWLLRLLLMGAGTVLVLLAGGHWLEGRAAWLYVPAFLGYAVLRAITGCRLYESKDAVLEVQSAGGGERHKVLLLVLLGTLSFLALLAWFLFEKSAS